MDHMQQAAAVAVAPLPIKSRQGHMKELRQVISHDVFKLLRDHFKREMLTTLDSLQLLKASVS